VLRFCASKNHPRTSHIHSRTYTHAQATPKKATKGTPKKSYTPKKTPTKAKTTPAKKTPTKVVGKRTPTRGKK
jgi:hypothetical protein